MLKGFIPLFDHLIHIPIVDDPYPRRYGVGDNGGYLCSLV